MLLGNYDSVSTINVLVETLKLVKQYFNLSKLTWSLHENHVNPNRSKITVEIDLSRPLN